MEKSCILKALRHGSDHIQESMGEFYFSTEIQVIQKSKIRSCWSTFIQQKRRLFKQPDGNISFWKGKHPVSRLVVACKQIVRTSIIRFMNDAICPVKYFRMLVWKDKRGERSLVPFFFFPFWSTTGFQGSPWTWVHLRMKLARAPACLRNLANMPSKSVKPSSAVSVSCLN